MEFSIVSMLRLPEIPEYRSPCVTIGILWDECFAPAFFPPLIAPTRSLWRKTDRRRVVRRGGPTRWRFWTPATISGKSRKPRRWTTARFAREKVPRNRAAFRDSVTDDFRVVSPAEFRAARRTGSIVSMRSDVFQLVHPPFEEILAATKRAIRCSCDSVSARRTSPAPGLDGVLVRRSFASAIIFCTRSSMPSSFSIAR